MHAMKTGLMALWVIGMLIVPFAAIPFASAYTPGDETAVFGHTFKEEYWTNSSIPVEDEYNNTATFTASYVGIGNFSAFLIAFNELVTNDSKTYMLPYQLFGMHFITPEDNEVFIGAVFAFLMVSIDNKTYANNSLPDVGHDTAWYILPSSTPKLWADITPRVEPIPAQKLSEYHYRFGMRYLNMSAKVVDANTPGGFLLSLIFPVLTVLISELDIQYDIVVDPTTGVVHVETLYTLGQVTRAKWLGLIPAPPSSIINSTMTVSAVHYMSVFTSNYKVTNSTSGNQLAIPTKNTPLNSNISITVGNDERAFDLGLGRQYSLINETTGQTVSSNETAVNALLAAKASDFLLVAWQAPLSAFLFAHMAYGLSEYVRSQYTSVADLVAHAPTAYHSSQWWYGVAFPQWNGLRVQQDPVYVSYTNPDAFLPQSTSTTTTTGTTPTTGTTTPPNGAGGLMFLAVIAVAIICIVYVVRRRR